MPDPFQVRAVQTRTLVNQGESRSVPDPFQVRTFCLLASLSPGQYVTLFYIYCTDDLTLTASYELHTLGCDTVQRQSLRPRLEGEQVGLKAPPLNKVHYK